MKTYLFDFDGTLVDSMPTFISGVLKELDKNNCVYGEDIIKIITPLGFNGTAE
jgi:beta-phosphoglucomutase-like phosphatase (HAD superfamily)